MADLDVTAEWLETDGLGGFASGTVGLVRTRRYHALLLAATAPPTGRRVLVDGCDVWLQTAAGTFPLSAQQYGSGATAPRGAAHLRGFAATPWPTWTFALPDGTEVQAEVCVPRGRAAVTLTFCRTAGSGPATLWVRPFVSGRDYHALAAGDAPAPVSSIDAATGAVSWQLGGDLPPVRAWHNGDWHDDLHRYRDFLLTEELERGFDHRHDLWSPGQFRFDLAAEAAELALTAGADDDRPAITAWRAAERQRRAAFASPLHRAADDYLVRRGDGLTVVAGYPWFADWGRDTFLSLRGLCLATGRLDDAGSVLRAWCQHLSDGMLPNRFPDDREPVEYNSADAPLWFAIAAGEWLAAMGDRADAADRRMLPDAVLAIVAALLRGARHGIRVAADGLLAAGEPGSQLTWMDARVDGVPQTPRIGKPVELQALWINTLALAEAWDPGLRPLRQRAAAAFAERFWNDANGCLFDVIDVDHVPGTADPTVRPNQILAIGGLPLALLPTARARAVLAVVERDLLTPMGLRSLAPTAPGYAPRYVGDPARRDRAYHQGTVWPWLLGPFVEAWVRLRGGTTRARNEARARFVAPLRRHLDAAGLGHVSEIADAEPPFTPRGCPFQAWSLAELLRLEHAVLAPPPNRPGRRAAAAVSSRSATPPAEDPT